MRQVAAPACRAAFWMLILLLGPFCVAVAAGADARGPWLVPDALWDRPRSAEAIRSQPAIRAAVTAWLATPGSSLVICPGHGQNAVLQADELRHWLIALAVDARQVSVMITSGQPAGSAGSASAVAGAGPVAATATTGACAGAEAATASIGTQMIELRQPLRQP